MKVNFNQAESIMSFIVKFEEMFDIKRPVSYQYMSHKLKEGNMVDVLGHIAKVMRCKPEVYERALRDLESRVTEDELENIKVKYAEFEQYYNTKKQEEAFNL